MLVVLLSLQNKAWLLLTSRYLENDRKFNLKGKLKFVTEKKILLSIICARVKLEKEIVDTSCLK